MEDDLITMSPSPFLWLSLNGKFLTENFVAMGLLSTRTYPVISSGFLVCSEAIGRDGKLGSHQRSVVVRRERGVVGECVVG